MEHPKEAYLDTLSARAYPRRLEILARWWLRSCSWIWNGGQMFWWYWASSISSILYIFCRLPRKVINHHSFQFSSLLIISFIGCHLPPFGTKASAPVPDALCQNWTLIRLVKRMTAISDSKMLVHICLPVSKRHVRQYTNQRPPFLVWL